LPTYEINSPVRNFIIDAINTMGEVHNQQLSVDEVNGAKDEEVDDASIWDDWK